MTTAIRAAGRERRVPLEGCPTIPRDVHAALADTGYLTDDQERRMTDAIEAAGWVIRNREYESKRSLVPNEEPDE